MHKSISEKTEKTGNYTVAQLTAEAVANMGPKDIKNAAAMIISKRDSDTIQVVSVRNLSILEQAMCSLPDAEASKIGTVIRYINKLPDGNLLISYFGAMPNENVLDALTKLAHTANGMNGAIFSGYAAMTETMGKEKHYAPGLTIPSGIANLRVISRNEVAFSMGRTVQKATLTNIFANKWNSATEIGSFAKNVIFMDRVQNNVTNVVTEDKIVRGYSLLTKTAAETLIQNSKLKVFSLVQWAKTAVITTPFGLTQEPAVSYAA